MTTALALRDAERLAELETTIAQGLTTFVEVGAALAEVRDARLYRGEHPTFEDYCRERWQMSKSRANQLVGAAEVVGNLATTVVITPATESQARPLTKLPPEQQREVWHEAVETAPKDETGKPKVTAAHVEATVKRATRPAQIVDEPEGVDVGAEITNFRQEYRRRPDVLISTYIANLPVRPKLDDRDVEAFVTSADYDRAVEKIVRDAHDVLARILTAADRRRQHVSA